MDPKILKIIQSKYEAGDFKYHISVVVKNALLLTNKLNADKNVVEMAAYLHDLGRSKAAGKGVLDAENKHHIIGAEMSRKFLKKQGYNEDFIEKVAYCVLTHRGRSGPTPETLEAKIVACADAMAHFDTFLYLIPVFIEITGSFDKAMVVLGDKLDRDWEKKLTLPEAKKMVKKEYGAAKLLINNMKKYM